MSEQQELPTSPGSVAETPDRQRWVLFLPFPGVLRWRCVTRWQRLSVEPDPDQFATMAPTVLFVADDWVDPRRPS